MNFLTIVLLLAIIALGFAHYKLHMSMAVIKADLLAEIAKLKALLTSSASKTP